MFFSGISTLNLDAKGRMAIPAKYRAALEECCESRVVVTVNPSRDRCLWLYPEDHWLKVAERVARMNPMDRSQAAMQRLLLGYASEQEMDRQGRILLSSELREYAGLDKKVSMLGQGSRFEIWDAGKMPLEHEQWKESAAEAAAENPELFADLPL